jgi:competence protein ComEA
MGRLRRLTETGLAVASRWRDPIDPGAQAMKKSVSILSLLLAALLSGAAVASEQVDINSADAPTLERVLDGVGPSKAEAIVAHREKHGAFRSADELAEVKGIGLSTIEQNRARITVGEGAADATAPAAPPVPAATAPAPAAATAAAGQ